MVLYKLEDFEPKYQEMWGGNDIKGSDVYADKNKEKVGSVKNILVDESGHFRYLVVDTGFWIFGKQVLLPVGRSRMDQNSGRIYAVGFTKDQAENLPEFNDSLKIDQDYENRVRGVYSNSKKQTPVEKSTSVEASQPLESSAPLDHPSRYQTPTINQSSVHNRNDYSYKQEPALYEMNEQDHQTLKLYEERLIAHKNRVKTGEVSISKQIETDEARISVPVEKERVIVERTTPTNAGSVATPNANTFHEGTVAQLEVYEETADIQKQAFVREEVKVTKESQQEKIAVQEQLRREKLNVNTEGQPILNDRNV